MGAHLTGASPLIFPASLCNFVAITPLGVSGGMLHVHSLAKNYLVYTGTFTGMVNLVTVVIASA